MQLSKKYEDAYNSNSCYLENIYTRKKVYRFFLITPWIVTQSNHAT